MEAGKRPVLAEVLARLAAVRARPRLSLVGRLPPSTRGQGSPHGLPGRSRTCPARRGATSTRPTRHSVAHEIPEAAVDADLGTRRQHLRAKAAFLGVLFHGSAEPVPPQRRRASWPSREDWAPLWMRVRRMGGTGCDGLCGFVRLGPSVLRARNGTWRGSGRSGRSNPGARHGNPDPHRRVGRDCASVPRRPGRHGRIVGPFGRGPTRPWSDHGCPGGPGRPRPTWSGAPRLSYGSMACGRWMHGTCPSPRSCCPHGWNPASEGASRGATPCRRPQPKPSDGSRSCRTARTDRRTPPNGGRGSARRAAPCAGRCQTAFVDQRCGPRPSGRRGCAAGERPGVRRPKVGMPGWVPDAARAPTEPSRADAWSPARHHFWHGGGRGSGCLGADDRTLPHARTGMWLPQGCTRARTGSRAPVAHHPSWGRRWRRGRPCAGVVPTRRSVRRRATSPAGAGPGPAPPVRGRG